MIKQGTGNIHSDSIIKGNNIKIEAIKSGIPQLKKMNILSEGTKFMKKLFTIKYFKGFFFSFNNFFMCLTIINLKHLM